VRYEFTAAGGWCAPSEALYDVGTDYKTLFPEVSVQRGGIVYRDLTPAEAAAQSAWRAHVTRISDQLADARSAAIDSACVIALAEGWDVHVYEPPSLTYDVRHATEYDLIRLRCIGIEFTPAERPVPTIHHHPYYEEMD
jgi:hypothetical protein